MPLTKERREELRASAPHLYEMERWDSGRPSVEELLALLDSDERLEGWREQILSNRYTEDQGIDMEMQCYNDGLEDAVRILRGETPETDNRGRAKTGEMKR